MTQIPQLNRDGEAAWRRFKQHLEWSDHFALVFIFNSDPRVTEIFRERLADIYRARVTRLRTFEVADPSELAEILLPKLLRPGVGVTALDAPYWIDLSRHAENTWRDARLNFLARLNEQRESLRRTLTRPLILALPAGERDQVKALVPDLWAIRDFSLESASTLLDATPIAQAAPAPAKEAIEFPLSDDEHQLIAEWERVRERDLLERGMLLAAESAIEVYLHKARFGDAENTSQHALALARRLAQSSGETPQALRDLSASLNNVGHVAQALSRWDEARAAYRDALAIAETLTRAMPENDDYQTLREKFARSLAELENVASSH